MPIDNEAALTQASSAPDGGSGGLVSTVAGSEAGSDTPSDAAPGSTWWAWGVLAVMLAATLAVLLASATGAGFWRDLRLGLDLEALLSR